MPTSRKCLYLMLVKLFTPMMQRSISNAKIPYNAGSSASHSFCEMNCFSLEFSCKCPLFLLHGLFPFCGSPFSLVSLPHFSGSRPGVCLWKPTI